MKSSRRRPKGEGSIVQRADGTWQFSVGTGYVDGVDASGKSARRRLRTYLYARTRAELIRKIADERARAGGTLKPRAEGTIGEWVTAWLEQEVRPNVASSTFAIWELAWRRHAKPLVADRKLEKFTPDDAAAVYATLRESDVGGRTLQLVGQVMRSAFEAAIRRQRLHGVNPWTRVSPPRHRAKEARALDAEEVARFVAAAHGDRYEALWLLCLLGGLRLGEVLGLEWKDVDLKTGRVNVRQQATQVGAKTTIGPLKTKSSRRTIDVGDVTLEALLRRRKEADRERHGSRFVFPTASGTHIGRPNLRRRHFAPICERAKVTGLRIHDLRHSMTSNAIAAGISPIVVAARLGHASTRMTLDRYGHQMPGQQREAAEALEARFGLKTGPRPKRRRRK